MQIINLKNPVPDVLQNAAVAIGNFDGLHKGHQQIITQVIETAKRNKTPAGILTFEPHPISFFSPDIKNYRLTPFDLKMKILDDMGLDFVAYAEFDKEFSLVTAKAFIDTYLKRKLKPSEVFTGEDFIFGHNRSGNSLLLSEMAGAAGFKYNVVSEIKDHEKTRYSSSLCREYIRNGQIEKAASILGRDYTISGKVIKGRELARGLGYPTANLKLDEYVLPQFGVYGIAAEIAGKTHKGIANIGVKPTYGISEPLLEAHIFNFNQNIYGQNIFVELKHFIREERKFNSIEELKAQIGQDIKLVI